MSELFVGNYFDNYTLAPVTDDMIQFAQEKLKVELPESYLTLMTTQNGGELRRRKLVIGEKVLSVDYLNGIGAKTGEGILLSSSLKKNGGCRANLSICLVTGIHGLLLIIADIRVTIRLLHILMNKKRTGIFI